MHVSLPLLVAMFTSTIALPTTDEPIALEKRDHFGWVGSFTNPDCQSNPDAKDQRPKIKTWVGDAKTPCIAFSPLPNEWIGINYGTGDLLFHTVEFFEDDICQNSTGVQCWPSAKAKGLGCLQVSSTVGSV